MKVAFISRSTLTNVIGGDTIQVNETARYLRKLGVEVDVYPANQKIDYKQYDLLHGFNLIRPADHLNHIQKSNIPFALSPIYLDYTHFDHFGRTGPSSRLFKLVGKYNAEYLKNMFRYTKRQDVLLSWEYVLGHKRAMKKVMDAAAIILPNSESEYRRIVLDFDKPCCFHIVPNGIDPQLFDTIPDVERNPGTILCVAQIYGMKNQHRLIEACKKLDLPLTIIGKTPPNHANYLEYCKQISHSKVEFIDFIPHAQLIKHYASAEIHALPSWFETTGLSTLEAGAMGCKLVVGNNGDTIDYFQGLAEFCSADSTESIILALEKSLNQPSRPSIREHILENYNWDTAARKTLEAYEEVINGSE